ncbi:sulfakinin receptor [Sarcoptes scabiei]|nr:sulfakinin receptor [Sarcoptes scabiei]
MSSDRIDEMNFSRDLLFVNQSFQIFLRYHHQWKHYLDLIERSIDLNLAFKIFLYIAYLLVFLLGISGNILVCYVVFRQSSMRSVTNIFIANLALSDILLCLFAVPFTPLYLLIYKEWIFGSIFCRLVPFFQGVSVYTSVLTLMLISIERYMVIIHPFKRHFTVSECVKAIYLIWLAAFILTLPYGIFIDVIPIPIPVPKLFKSSSSSISAFTSTTFAPETSALSSEQSSTINSRNSSRPLNLNQSLETFQEMLINLHNNKIKWYCDEVWPDDRLRLAFGITTTVMQFVIPFLIITFCYLKVVLRLWDRMQNRLGARNYSSQRQWFEKERARRTNLMLIFMVCIFVISWLPLNTYNLIEDFYIPVTYWKHSRAIFMTFHLIAMSSTCYNPFIYTWLNDAFRKEFNRIFQPLLNDLNWFLYLVCDKRKKSNKDLNDWTRHSSAINNQIVSSGIQLNKLGDSAGATRLNHSKIDNTGEMISMTNVETTTNMVTNLESINEIELQESLFITSLQNRNSECFDD